MVRNVSFGLLIAVIAVLAFVFYKVMASFFLPLFLAALLVVIFRPVHIWAIGQFSGRPKTAAFSTTVVIMAIVFVPLIWVVFFAIAESRQVVQRIDSEMMTVKLRQMRKDFDLDLPSAGLFADVDQAMDSLSIHTARIDPLLTWQSQGQSLVEDAKEYVQTLHRLAAKNEWEWSDRMEMKDLTSIVDDDARNWMSFMLALNSAKVKLEAANFDASDSAESERERTDPRLAESDTKAVSETKGAEEDESLQAAAAVDEVGRETLDACQKDWRKACDRYAIFKTAYLGGFVREALKTFANPSESDLASYVSTGADFLKAKLLSFGGTTVAFLGRLFFSSAIMAIALYFFLLDGPSMLRALKSLSPLDDEHEQQLIEEFDRISRAVLVATLLSAVAQGVLAGIGFYFTGLDSVVMLMLLTTIVSLIPFVGAAAIWVPACGWLLVFEGRPVAAMLLAIYGTAIISMADNVIKPMVLHGQSNIHPLWALLSVLGGVVALGPIGILVGPMVMALLQTMLQILQRELTSMERMPEMCTDGNYLLAEQPDPDLFLQGQPSEQDTMRRWHPQKRS